MAKARPPPSMMNGINQLQSHANLYDGKEKCKTKMVGGAEYYRNNMTLMVTAVPVDMVQT